MVLGLLAAVLLQAAAAPPDPARSGGDGAAAAYGLPLEGGEAERFLLRAEVVARKPIGRGVTWSSDTGGSRMHGWGRNASPTDTTAAKTVGRTQPSAPASFCISPGDCAMLHPWKLMLSTCRMPLTLAAIVAAGW